ncbi:response regulator transcription factor [Pedobacter jamesrossensis]|uniref:Response regulator transcription factor n=1 Tax=Pedobacter jamesrossensis TaxID=1908238 RepID=A0ABV8NSR4_9SPHI
MPRIGIAEDDKKIAELLKTAFEENDYEAEFAFNGIQALELFTEKDFDLYIIDIMMPGINGIQLCKQLRENHLNNPILMLTAMGGVDDKVIAFEAGADDYLVKPFHLKELLVRVGALFRRNFNLYKEETQKLCYQDLCLDTYSKEVTRSGEVINLSAKEFILLELFLRNPNRLLSRRFIAEQAWDINFDTGTNVIDVYINFLRKKIDKDFERKLIHTKINMGYILK